jgi:hypothetical protein
MLRHSGLRKTQLAGQVDHASFTGGEPVQDGEPSRASKGPELGHGRTEAR